MQNLDLGSQGQITQFFLFYVSFFILRTKTHENALTSGISLYRFLFISNFYINYVYK